MSDALTQLTRRLVAFRQERDWEQFHTLKNLMMSLSIEAAELLELAQWKDERGVEAALADPDYRAKFMDECADVLLYLLLIAERADLDLVAAASAKIDKNARKYPVEKARGTAKKYDEL